MIINIEGITDAEFVELQLCLFSKGYMWASQDKPKLKAFPTYSFNGEEIRCRSNGISLANDICKLYFAHVWEGMEKSFPNEKIVNFMEVFLESSFHIQRAS